MCACSRHHWKVLITLQAFQYYWLALGHSLGRQLHSVEIYVHLRNKIFLSQPTLSDCWFGSHSELKNIFKIPLIPMETFWGTKILPSSEEEEFWNQFLLHVRYSLILMDIHPGCTLYCSHAFINWAWTFMVVNQQVENTLPLKFYPNSVTCFQHWYCFGNISLPATKSKDEFTDVRPLFAVCDAAR